MFAPRALPCTLTPELCVCVCDCWSRVCVYVCVCVDAGGIARVLHMWVCSIWSLVHVDVERML